SSQNATFQLVGEGREAVVIHEVIRHLEIPEGFDEWAGVKQDRASRPDNPLGPTPEQKRPNQFGELAWCIRQVRTASLKINGDIGEASGLQCGLFQIGEPPMHDLKGQVGEGCGSALHIDGMEGFNWYRTKWDRFMNSNGTYSFGLGPLKNGESNFWIIHVEGLEFTIDQVHWIQFQ